jgi:TolB protein
LYALNFDLYVATADGRTLRRLTSLPGWEQRPAWSPDGQQLAFESRPRAPEPLPIDVFAVRVDGTDLRQLTRDGTSAGPRWLPDGRVTFTRDGARFAMRADGTGTERLEGATALGAQPTQAWSPDGAHIAFDGWGTRPSAIWVARADGTERRRLTGLTEGDCNAFDPAWSPDGRQLAFTGCAANLEIINVDGSARRRAAPENYQLDWSRGPASWAPDGLQIAMSTRERVTDGARIFVAGVADGRVTRLTSTRMLEIQPTWRPRGR